MSFKIYHQCGHNTIWNKDAFLKKGAGDGLILSPVHEDCDRINNQLNGDGAASALFDPQFYLPNSTKRKLATYEFFPDAISQGFRTSDYGMFALESARRCLQFQIDSAYEAVVIPARYYSQMIPYFCARQSEYAVTPFLAALKEQRYEGRVFATLPVTSHMVESEAYRDMLLNWITGYPEIHGVYVIISAERTTKQIKDAETIFRTLEFLTLLKDAGLEIIVGYCNTESMLYSVVGDIAVTFGAFENTRIFTLDKFVESEGDQRGPRPRIYMPGLMNWIQLEQAREIRRRMPAVWTGAYVGTEDSETALNALVPWTFNKPELYRHHFEVASDQVRGLSELSRMERYEKLDTMLVAAERFYNDITSGRLDLDPHGNGSHIMPWRNALGRYRNNYLQ
jgi:hypothetical protein